MASKAGYARGETRKIGTIASNSKTFALIREMTCSFSRMQQDDAALCKQCTKLRWNGP